MMSLSGGGGFLGCVEPRLYGPAAAAISLPPHLAHNVSISGFISAMTKKLLNTPQYVFSCLD